MRNRRNSPLKVIFYLFFGVCLFVGVTTLVEHSLVRPSTVSASGNIDLDQARPAQIYAVSPDILAVEVAAPEVTLGRQLPYVSPRSDDPVSGEARDRTIQQKNGQTQVRRNGKPLGILVGKNQDILYSYDEIANSSFQPSSADQVENYRITSRSDRRYRQSLSPVAVARKTKPVAFARSAGGRRQWAKAHTLYLTLPEPIRPGNTYQLSFPNLNLASGEFVYDPMVVRSEAVHVSQLGFRPEDPFKSGYLSTWMGNGGGARYPDGLRFQLVDTRSGQPMYSGVATRRRVSTQVEDPRNRDYTLSEVHQLDFSDFKSPGDYRLCVEGVGCSFDFEIGNSVWQQAFAIAARGFLHQRSGVAMGPPHTRFVRPRAFHPDDGLKVYQSTATLLNVNMGLGEKDAFESLLAGKTDDEVTDVWGGYFDAGDWDRRIQHLSVPRSLLELHNLFPEHFKAVNLNLPESSNSLPDILDEALWSLDFFRRLQMPDGGIRGGIESAGHPKRGEASWQESQLVMAYAPDVWSSYWYAGVAARAAVTLRAYDAELADTYKASALQAMAYAESRYQADDYTDGKKLHDVVDQRNLAALELYRLTQDATWHDLFLATTVFQSDSVGAYVHGKHDQREAAFLYARLAVEGSTVEASDEGDIRSDDTKPSVEFSLSVDSQPGEAQPVAAQPGGDDLIPLRVVTVPAVDAQVQANARNAFLRRADDLVKLTTRTAFGWSRQRPKAPVGWRNGLGAPTATDILRAHALTGKRDYLIAGLSGTQFAVGANPANMVFTTGMGDRSPQNPLISDYRLTGQAPPPGITVFGPADFSFYSDYWTLDVIAKDTFPAPRYWPTVENYFDIYSYPIGAEFTVQYMVASAYTWGYLAARED